MDSKIPHNQAQTKNGQNKKRQKGIPPPHCKTVSYQGGSTKKLKTMSTIISMAGSQQVQNIPTVRAERRDILLKYEIFFKASNLMVKCKTHP